MPKEPAEVNTTVEYEHLKGRKYEIKCDKKHRPAQIHRDTLVVTFADADGVSEVHGDNVGDFDLMYIRQDVRNKIEKIFGAGGPDPDAPNYTFNEMLDLLLPLVEQASASGHLPGGMADLANFVKKGDTTSSSETSAAVA